MRKKRSVSQPVQPKRKRGRPKGSKNKKKIINKPSTESNTIDVSNVRSYKLLGRCPKCSSFICSKDLVSKVIFECTCGERSRINKLKQQKGTDLKKQGISKQEYLRQSINAEYYDMPAYGPAPVMERSEDDD
jgi:hypothetical protein